MARIIIAGSRTFDDYELLCHVMDHLTRKMTDVTVLSGACPDGADPLGEKWAWRWWWTVERYHAEWDKHGKGAGIIRNKEMVKAASHLVAFWNGKSPGTKDIIEQARKANLKVKVVLFEDN